MRKCGRAVAQVKLRMDFTAISVGTFVYHCHILGHEDGGMMAKVRGRGVRVVCGLRVENQTREEAAK